MGDNIGVRPQQRPDLQQIQAKIIEVRILRDSRALVDFQNCVDWAIHLEEVNTALAAELQRLQDATSWAVRLEATIAQLRAELQQARFGPGEKFGVYEVEP